MYIFLIFIFLEYIYDYLYKIALITLTHFYGFKNSEKKSEGFVFHQLVSPCILKEEKKKRRKINFV